MSYRSILSLFISVTALSSEIPGEWISDCQNLSGSTNYKSSKPVDKFESDGTVTLRFHVYEKNGCQGKEWDEEIIPCTYFLGKEVSGLTDTRELDLNCQWKGKEVFWYEIAQVLDKTLRFGDHTGETVSDRPFELGGVVYHRK